MLKTTGARGPQDITVPAQLLMQWWEQAEALGRAFQPLGEDLLEPGDSPPTPDTLEVECAFVRVCVAEYANVPLDQVPHVGALIVV